MLENLQERFLDISDSELENLNEKMDDYDEKAREDFKKINETHKTIKRLLAELLQYREIITPEQIRLRKIALNFGLTQERIQQFHTYKADDAMVGDRCDVCLEDVELGTRMVRLDCNHAFCQRCVEKWFVDRKTCPTRRNQFA